MKKEHLKKDEMLVKPILKEWCLCFCERDKDEEREKYQDALIHFSDFWNGKVQKAKLSVDVRLRGDVYGKEKFEEGEQIVTSTIRFFERVGEDGCFAPDGEPHDLICATTKTGSKYYMYTDEANPLMDFLLYYIETTK